MGSSWTRNNAQPLFNGTTYGQYNTSSNGEVLLACQAKARRLAPYELTPQSIWSPSIQTRRWISLFFRLSGRHSLPRTSACHVGSGPRRACGVLIKHLFPGRGRLPVHPVSLGQCSRAAFLLSNGVAIRAVRV